MYNCAVQHDIERTVETATAELLRSADFRSWRPRRLRPVNPKLSATEIHFSPAELAKLWGVSTETVRTIFREEPGVLKIGKPGTRFRRGYFTLRIPKTVAERVHQRLSEGAV